MKKKWELARYLIDAKKCVDSIWYVSDNAEKLRFIDLRKKCKDIRSEFFINCCVVLDEYVLSKKIKKSILCDKDNIVQRIYYERDKNSAHKDDQYEERTYNSIEDIWNEMSEQLAHVRDLTSAILPKEITLDYVCHDKELFRLVHHLTADEEEEILKKKYPLRNLGMGNGVNGRTFKILNDTEELRRLTKEQKKEYCVIIKDGICFNEGIQEMQDACIKINALYDEKMWVSMNKKEMGKLIELTKLGCFDDYGIIQPPPKDPILLALINKILESPIED